MVKSNFPHFFGIQHEEGSSEKSTQRKVQEMKESLKPFLGKGVRCFLEASQGILEGHRAEKTGAEGHSGRIYSRLVKWLDKRRIEIVPLDKSSMTRLLFSHRDFCQLRRSYPDKEAVYYLNSYLREKHWARTVKLHAKPGDIVVMHPAHLQTFAVRENLPENRVHFTHRINWLPGLIRRPRPLTKQSLRRFEERIAKKVNEEQKMQLNLRRESAKRVKQKTKSEKKSAPKRRRK